MLIFQKDNSKVVFNFSEKIEVPKEESKVEEKKVEEKVEEASVREEGSQEEEVKKEEQPQEQENPLEAAKQDPEQPQEHKEQSKEEEEKKDEVLPKATGDQIQDEIPRGEEKKVSLFNVIFLNIYFRNVMSVYLYSVLMCKT